MQFRSLTQEAGPSGSQSKKSEGGLINQEHSPFLCPTLGRLTTQHNIKRLSPLFIQNPRQASKEDQRWSSFQTRSASDGQVSLSFLLVLKMVPSISKWIQQKTEPPQTVVWVVTLSEDIRDKTQGDCSLSLDPSVLYFQKTQNKVRHSCTDDSVNKFIQQFNQITGKICLHQSLISTLKPKPF